MGDVQSFATPEECLLRKASIKTLDEFGEYQFNDNPLYSPDQIIQYKWCPYIRERVITTILVQHKRNLEYKQLHHFLFLPRHMILRALSFLPPLPRAPWWDDREFVDAFRKSNGSVLRAVAVINEYLGCSVRTPPLARIEDVVALRTAMSWGDQNGNTAILNCLSRFMASKCLTRSFALHVCSTVYNMMNNFDGTVEFVEAYYNAILAIASTLEGKHFLEDKTENRLKVLCDFFRLQGRSGIVPRKDGTDPLSTLFQHCAALERCNDDVSITDNVLAPFFPCLTCGVDTLCPSCVSLFHYGHVIGTPFVSTAICFEETKWNKRKQKKVD